MACCNKKCCTSCCLVSSVLLVLFAGLIYVITNPLIYAGTKVSVVVTSENSSFYADWACKYSTSEWGPCAVEHYSIPFYEDYMMFNITNFDEVMQGGKPQIMEHGPYAYIVNVTKYDIQFIDEGRSITYGESRMYNFVPERSCEGCTPSDEFIMTNPGYLGVLDVTKRESVIILGLAGPAINKMLNDIVATYITDLLAEPGNDWLATCQGIDSDCEDEFDMAMVQFGYYARIGGAIGLNNERVNDLYPEVFPTRAEYSALTVDRPGGYSPLTIAQLDKTLYGEYGIVVDPLHLLEMLGAMNDTEELEEKWGLDRTEVLSFMLYVLDIADTYSRTLFDSATVLEKGGGLFSKRSVHEWVFHFVDPLLVYMQPSDTETAIRYNDTTTDDAESYKPGRWMINSGTDDFSQIAQVQNWNGTSVVNFWAGPVNVTGNNQEGQFFLVSTDGRGNLPETLPLYDVWSPDHGRTIYLEDFGVTPDLENLYDIPCRRVLLSNDTYLPDPFWFLEPEFEGFVNASSFHMDPPFRKRLVFSASTPLFLSQPRMWGVTGNWTEKFDLLNTVPNLEECATIIDIEPISGNAMRAYRRLQVNWYIADNGALDRVYNNIEQNIIYPSISINQFSVVSEELSEFWYGSMGLILNFRDYFFIIGLVVGCVLIVVCTFLLIKYSKEGPKQDYQAIN